MTSAGGRGLFIRGGALVLLCIGFAAGFAGTAEAAPPLRVTGYAIDDPAPGGNGDGALEPGETAFLRVEVLNIDGAPQSATGQLKMGGWTTGVIILDNSAAWPSIPGNSSAGVFSNDHFLVRVSSLAPCAQVLSFEVILTPSPDTSQTVTTLEVPLGRRPAVDFVPGVRRFDSPEATFFGASGGSLTGADLIVADMNRDGKKDVIIGAPNASAGAGRVYIFYGRSDVLSDVDLLSPGAPAPTIIGGLPGGSNLGANLAVGDFDGDANLDLFISSRLNSDSRSKVWVIYGRVQKIPNFNLSIANPDVTRFDLPLGPGGVTGLGSGDVDGDGAADLVIGSGLSTWQGGPLQSGYAWVVYGLPGTHWSDTALEPGQDIDRITSSVIFEQLGQSVRVGDLDADGLADIVLGAMGHGIPGKVNVGAVYAVFGSPVRLGDIDVDSHPGRSQFTGVDQDDKLSAAAIGDFDGDGIKDLLMAAPSADSLGNTRVDTGEALLWYGPMARGLNVPLSTTSGLHIWGAGTGGLGTIGGIGGPRGVAFGDLDGDGIQDMLLGSFNNSPDPVNRPAVGEVFAVRGGARLVQNIDLATPPGNVTVFVGGEAGDNLGTAIAAGDVDGDGYDDLLATQGGGDGPGNARLNAGEVVLWYGRPSRTFVTRNEVISPIPAQNGGTLLPLACDDCSTQVGLGFAFPYDGQSFTSVFVSSNGFLSFKPVGDNFQSSHPACMPSRTDLAAVDGVVAPLWADLNPATGGGVFMKTEGAVGNRRTTFEWFNVNFFNGLGPITFEVTLFEATGQILMQYLDLDAGHPSYNNGATGVVGVEGLTGRHGVAYQCFSGTQLASVGAVRFMPTSLVLQQNAEKGLGHWGVSGAANNSWHVSTDVCEPDQNSGAHSLYAGFDDAATPVCNYDAGFFNVDWPLDAPTIPALPSDARFTYASRSQVDGGLFSLDHMSVAVSTAGQGGPYTAIQDFLSVSNAWQILDTPLDLRPFAGQTLDLRLTLHPDSSGNSGLGWMVDDLRVVGCNAPAPPPGSGLASIVPLGPTSFCVGQAVVLDGTLSFCPDGTPPQSYGWFVDGLPLGNPPIIITGTSLTAGNHVYTLTIGCPGGVMVSSGPLSVTVQPPPTVGDTLIITQPDATHLEAHWTDVPGATSYALYWGTSANGPFDQFLGSVASGVTGIVFPAPPPTAYFKVFATGPCGTGM